MKRVIGVDIDGCLCDFNTHFIEYVIAVTGRDLFPPRPFEIPCWNYPQMYGYTDAELKRVWANIECSDSFWASLPKYDDTKESLSYLRELERVGVDVYFITSRPGLTAKDQTEWWLYLNGYTNPTVLISSAKGLAASALNLDVFIDDRWENALDVAQTRTRSVLMNRPWNQLHPAENYGITRTDSMVGFADAPVETIQ